MSDPKIIYLGPACQKEGDGREWCEDDVWPQCECGCSSVRYVLESDAQSELAALREELAAARATVQGLHEAGEFLDEVNQGIEDGLRKSLAAAEQRNAACNAEIVAMVESALRRSFSLGQVYWQQADSDSNCQQNKSDQTMETQAQHILNVVKSIKDLTKYTESGASE